jgi:hypothetical protein
MQNAVANEMDEEPTPLDFLKAVYLNEGLPLTARMRAATEAAPYMHAKLGAIDHFDEQQ